MAKGQAARRERSPGLGELAAALRRLVIAARSIAEPHRYDALADSPARADCEAHPDLAAYPRLLPDTYRHGAMQLYQAEDHALGLADLIRARHTFACHPVARALAETSARSFHLFEPNVDATERLRRLWNEVMWALHEAVTMQAARDPALRADAESRLASYAADVRAIGAHVSTPKRGAPHVGQQRAGAGPLLDRLLAHGVDGEMPSSWGRLFNSTVSAVTHGAAHSFLLLTELGAEPPGNSRPLARRVAQTPADVADSLVAAPLAFAVAYGVAAEQMGWDTGALDAAIRRFLTVWRSAFTDYEHTSR